MLKVIVHPVTTTTAIQTILHMSLLIPGRVIPIVINNNVIIAIIIFIVITGTIETTTLAITTKEDMGGMVNTRTVTNTIVTLVIQIEIRQVDILVPTTTITIIITTVTDTITLLEIIHPLLQTGIIGSTKYILKVTPIFIVVHTTIVSTINTIIMYTSPQTHLIVVLTKQIIQTKTFQMRNKEIQTIIQQKK